MQAICTMSDYKPTPMRFPPEIGPGPYYLVFTWHFHGPTKTLQLCTQPVPENYAVGARTWTFDTIDDLEKAVPQHVGSKWGYLYRSQSSLPETLLEYRREDVRSGTWEEPSIPPLLPAQLLLRRIRRASPSSPKRNAGTNIIGTEP